MLDYSMYIFRRKNEQPELALEERCESATDFINEFLQILDDLFHQHYEEPTDEIIVQKLKNQEYEIETYPDEEVCWIKVYAY